MKKRSVAAVILLPFITLGIYTLYWYVSTKGELNAKGANIPTAWLIIVPFVNIWWMWKYYEGAELVTNKKVSGALMFVLALLVTSLISSAVCQDSYNKLSESPEQPILTSTDSQQVGQVQIDQTTTDEVPLGTSAEVTSVSDESSQSEPKSAEDTQNKV